MLQPCSRAEKAPTRRNAHAAALRRFAWATARASACAVVGLAGASATLAPACRAQPLTAAEARDERRPAQPLSVVLLERAWRFGGSWDYSDEDRINFDLNRARARDRRVREHEMQLELGVRLDADNELFAQLVALHETRRTEGTEGKLVDRALERGQMWWLRERLGGTSWSLQLGRIAWLDRRAWWWDDDLDAIRLRGGGSTWRLETGLARELARASSDERAIAPAARALTRWFGQVSWLPAPRHAFDFFWLTHDDTSGAPAPGAAFAEEDATDPSDLRARWWGLRLAGEWRTQGGARLAYWVDGAQLSGHEHLSAFTEQADGSFAAGGTATQPLAGRAFDIGLTGTLALPLRPALSVARARGSAGFRQTGLQENKARWAGVRRWRRYGELLQPELANLTVTSVGLGLRLRPATSLELVAHRFEQVEAARSIRGGRLSARPQGSSRALGDELNLLLASRESRHIEPLFKLSWFRPGAAFAPGLRDTARAVEVGVSINF